MNNITVAAIATQQQYHMFQQVSVWKYNYALHTATKVQQHVGVGYIIRTSSHGVVYMEQCHDSREIAVKYILHTT